MGEKYFKLQLKSAFKIYPTILLVTLITIISIVATCCVMLHGKNDSEGRNKISVGVVGSLEDSYLNIGLNALKNIDDSQFYIEMRDYEEKDAVAALKRQEINGYMHIPDNYVNRIYWGENVPAKYVTSNSPQGFGAIISAEIVQIVSHIVTESQNGMYSMQYLARDYNVTDMRTKIDKLMLSYVDFIINRSEMYKVTTLGISDELSFSAYYICGLLMLFMLLWGISTNRIFTSKNMAYSRILNAYGVRPATQVICEYMAYLAVSVVTLLLFALVFGTALQYAEVNIPELVGVGVRECMLFVVGILPVVVMITIMQFAFYELIPNPLAAVLTQFILAIVLGYISGCFYPNSFFPDIVQKISSCLTVGAGFSYIRKIMAGTVPVSDFFIAAIYSAFFLFVSVRARNYKVAGDIK